MRAMEQQGLTRAQIKAGMARLMEQMAESAGTLADAQSTFSSEQVVELEFGPVVQEHAAKASELAGAPWHALSTEARLFALEISAKALRDRSLAAGAVPPAQPPALSHRPVADGTIAVTHRPSILEFLEYRQRDGISMSHYDEMKRALDRMAEALGPDRPVAEATSEDLRRVRLGFQKFDKRKQGKAASFTARQTDDPKFWIAPQTSGRYWSTVQAYFAWLRDDGFIPDDPAERLRRPTRVNRPPATPDPFSNVEVEAILRTPLFAGRATRVGRTRPGHIIERDSYWWALMIGLHTGMRAGEIAQLEVTDVDFGAEIPVFHVRREGADGKVTKSVKNAASVRDVPISPVLVKLGLAAFVATRSRTVASKRLFPDIAIGPRGKTSSGMTHFFRRYWEKTGLKQPGRSTHVFRHTVADNLRAAGILEEVIEDVVGHAAKTQTRRYGRKLRPLTERRDAIEKLNYGVDIPFVIEQLECAAGERARGHA